MKGILAAVCLLVVFPPGLARALVETPAFSTTSEDGGSWMSFHLAVQLRWRYGLLEEGPGDERVTDNQVLFRRIRPVIKGKLFDSELSYLLHLNLVPGYLELMDLWLDYRLAESLSVRVGQAKIPFTRYRLCSFKDRPVIEWSYPTRWFGAERQMGITLHNGIGRPPEYEYQLGFYTGANIRAANGIGMSKIFGEKFESPSSLVDPSPFENMHSEIVAHLAYNSEGIDLRRPSDLEGGPPRFSVGISGAWDLRPSERQDMRLRIAPEAEFRAYGFAVGGVMYLGFWDEVTGQDTYGLGLLGGVLQASYVFLEKYEIGARYTLIHIMEDLRADARSWAEQQIEQDREIGGLIREHEVNLGFNLYLHGTTFKWQVDAGILVHQRIDGDRTDFQLRTQLQLAF
jgi:hypothetical protein